MTQSSRSDSNAHEKTKSPKRGFAHLEKDSKYTHLKKKNLKNCLNMDVVSVLAPIGQSWL